MLYGASRVQKTIRTHPNHEHLLKVLRDTRRELMAGKDFGGSQSDTEGQAQWPSEKHETDPSASSTSSFDDNTLLTDDEINRQNQGGISPPSRGC